MSETIACTCRKPDCARCTWNAAADVFGATGDHDRCTTIVANAIGAGVDRSREEWGDGYCPRQHCDEEWLDAQTEHAYRAGFDRAILVADLRLAVLLAAVVDGGRFIRHEIREITLAGPNPTDMRADLERAAQENP